jgi:hypothetical protein
MPISSVSTALDLINKTSKALSSVREQAKTSKDATLKENISKLYDDFLDLKAVILRLTEEVTALKAVQTRTPMVFRAPFYYQDNDATPFCPACREGQEERAVHLTKNADGWHCTVCRNTFFGYDDDPNVAAFNIA